MYIIKKIISRFFWSIPVSLRPRVMAWLEKDANYGDQIAPGLFYTHGANSESSNMDQLFQASGFTTLNSPQRWERLK